MPSSEAITLDRHIFLSRIELVVLPEKGAEEMLKDDQLFILSPCLSALCLPIKRWSK